MPTYHVDGFNAAGEPVYAFMKAKSVDEVRARLQAHGVFVEEMQRVPSPLPWSLVWMGVVPALMAAVGLLNDGSIERASFPITLIGLTALSSAMFAAIVAIDHRITQKRRASIRTERIIAEDISVDLDAPFYGHVQNLR